LLKAIAELLIRFIPECFLARLLNGVDCDFELQVFERGVISDGLKGFLEVIGLGVGWKGLDNAAWRCYLQVGLYAQEILFVSGEQGYSKIAVFGVG